MVTVLHILVFIAALANLVREGQAQQFVCYSDPFFGCSDSSYIVEITSSGEQCCKNGHLTFLMTGSEVCAVCADNEICYSTNDTMCSPGMLSLGIGTGSIHDCCLVKPGSGNYKDRSGNCFSCSDKELQCNRGTNCDGDMLPELSGPSNLQSLDVCCAQGNGSSYTFNGQCFPCIVFGWSQNSLEAPEANLIYTLPVGYLKGGSVGTTIHANITVLPGTAENTDFTLNSTSVQINPSSLSDILLTLHVDNIALEGVETFTLQLEVPESSLPRSAIFLDEIFVSILDSNEITCSDLPDIANGMITYNMAAPRPLNTTAMYKCDVGFKLEGESERHCLENGTFSGVAPVCSMIRSLLIQLRLKGVDRCQSWVANNGRQKLSTTDTTLVNNVEERCKCGFSSTNIISSDFRCFEESESAVTYRAEIRGTPLAETSQVVSFIEEWLSQGALIMFDIVLVHVDDSCPVVVTSFADPECNSPTVTTTGLTAETMSSSLNNPTTTITTTDSVEQSGTLASIVGGVIGAVIAVLVIAMIIIIITIVSIRKRRTKVFNLNSSRYAVRNATARESKYEDNVMYRADSNTYDKILPPPTTYASPHLSIPPAEYDYPVATESGHNNEFDYTQCAAYVATSRQEQSEEPGHGGGVSTSSIELPLQDESSV